MILIVDDHLDTCAVLKRLLERMGHRVMCADSGGAALELAAKVMPQLIILDYMMPGMSGMDVLRTVKARSELRSVPVVMYSASPGHEEREQALTLGAEAWLSKGMEWGDLLRGVQDIFRRRPPAT